MSMLSPNVYGAAFAHWRHVQQQLNQTVQDYVDACTTLNTALAILPKDHLSHCKQAEAFAHLDSQLPFLPSYEQKLCQARLSLNTRRNSSKDLVPIHLLPPEVLDAIFILVVREGAEEVCAITSVCKLWRHMTLQSPACWSQIEIPFGPQDNLAYEHALLWAERAQNEPLHISLWERLHTKGGFTYTDADVSRAVDFLAPLMSRVCAMSFQTDGCELDHLLSRLLACWAERGTVGTAKILEVDAGDVGVVDIRATSSFLAQVSLEKSQAFFCSLHTLSLTDVTLDRRLGFYSGLVDLYLGLTGASSSYSQWEIAAILAASPRLRSLAIFGVIDQTGTPGTVALNDLNTLQLESWMVLQMITSTSTSIRMRLSLENHEEFIPAARSFFERCKVTALHICSSAAYPPISSLFTYMPHLKLLAIESSSLFDEAWQGSTRPDGSSLDLWPQLDELYLANCDLNQNALPRLVSIHAPRAIWVIGDNWSVEARDQAEEVLQQHAVQFVWFKVWDPVSVEFWTLAASKFVSY